MTTDEEKFTSHLKASKVSLDDEVGKDIWKQIEGNMVGGQTFLKYDVVGINGLKKQLKHQITSECIAVLTYHNYN